MCLFFQIHAYMHLQLKSHTCIHASSTQKPENKPRLMEIYICGLRTMYQHVYNYGLVSQFFRFCVASHSGDRFCMFVIMHPDHASTSKKPE
jgi:hypothetical protein